MNTERMIPPRLTLPMRGGNGAPHSATETTEMELVTAPPQLYIDRMLQQPLAVPSMNRRARLALWAQLAVIAAGTLGSIVVAWWLPVPAPGIYRLVISIILLVAGCMVASLGLSARDRRRLAVEALLVTGRVPVMERIGDLERKVGIDTTGFLKAVRRQP